MQTITGADRQTDKTNRQRQIKRQTNSQRETNRQTVTHTD